MVVFLIPKRHDQRRVDDRASRAGVRRLARHIFGAVVLGQRELAKGTCCKRIPSCSVYVIVSDQPCSYLPCLISRLVSRIDAYTSVKRRAKQTPPPITDRVITTAMIGVMSVSRLACDANVIAIALDVVSYSEPIYRSF
jgi:hypothetical protein